MVSSKKIEIHDIQLQELHQLPCFGSPVRAPDQTGARLWHTDSRGGAEQVALSLLHKLLTEPDAGASMMSGPVGHTVRSTLAGAKSHFLLTLAHYTYFHHRPEL